MENTASQPPSWTCEGEDVEHIPLSTGELTKDAIIIPILGDGLYEDNACMVWRIATPPHQVRNFWRFFLLINFVEEDLILGQFCQSFPLIALMTSSHTCKIDSQVRSVVWHLPTSWQSIMFNYMFVKHSGSTVLHRKHSNYLSHSEFLSCSLDVSVRLMDDFSLLAEGAGSGAHTHIPYMLMCRHHQKSESGVPVPLRKNSYLRSMREGNVFGRVCLFTGEGRDMSYPGPV